MASEYKVGELVWAKLKGYPWWPARIENESALSKRVTSKKPKSPKPIWPVFFFGSRDYGWFGKEALRPFAEGMSDYGSINKKGNLFATAMKQAQDPSLLEEIEEEERALIDNKKGTKSLENSTTKDKKKAAKKETLEPTDEDNEIYAGNDGKRKRKPVTRASREVPLPKKQALEPISRKNSSSSDAPAPNQNDLTTIDENSKPKSLKRRNHSATPPPALLEETDIDSLRTLRQALQKATIRENYENMEHINSLLTKLEQYPTNPIHIKESKIGKLLRHIILTSIPENSFEFKARFRFLCNKFKQSLAEAQDQSKTSPRTRGARGNIAKSSGNIAASIESDAPHDVSANDSLLFDVNDAPCETTTASETTIDPAEARSAEHPKKEVVPVAEDPKIESEVLEPPADHVESTSAQDVTTPAKDQHILSDDAQTEGKEQASAILSPEPKNSSNTELVEPSTTIETPTKPSLETPSEPKESEKVTVSASATTSEANSQTAVTGAPLAIPEQLDSTQQSSPQCPVQTNSTTTDTPQTTEKEGFTPSPRATTPPPTDANSTSEPHTSTPAAVSSH